MNLYIRIGEGCIYKGYIMKTLSVATIVKNITTSITSKGFQEALSWNLVGNRIDVAFLGGFATVVAEGVILDFEVEIEVPFLIECSQEEAYLLFSCFHNKGLFLDVLGSSVYTGESSFGAVESLEEFNEPAKELVGPTWTASNRMAWLLSEDWFYLTDSEQWEVSEELKAIRDANEREEERLDALYEEKMLAMEERQYD